MAVTHCAFADETNWNVGRYRGIALVSLSASSVPRIRDDLVRILTDCQVTEFKWSRLRTAKLRFAAESMVGLSVEAASRQALRVDVLTWDIQDSRHKLPRRDDQENLARMYYHLGRNVFQRRWPSGASWGLYPDENGILQWDTLQQVLEIASQETEYERSLLTQGRIFLRLKRQYHVEEIRPLESRHKVLIQLADLFAGLAAFSREKYGRYNRWYQVFGPQAALFPESLGPSDLSCSDRERFKLLQTFDDLCKARTLGVSLATHRGLRTLHPANPLNFWWYEPQHPGDRAPVRNWGRHN